MDRQSWRKMGGLCLVFLLLLGGLYGKIFLELMTDWYNNNNYSHGFFVPLVSGWLIWQQRETLATLIPQGDWIGLPVLLGGLGALLLGNIAAEEFLMRSSFVLVIAGLILFHLGTAVFRVVAFPVAFLFFMIPLPVLLFNAVAFPLQGFAAQNATWMLDLLGVPVLRDGNVIYLSHITLGVTEACSGIRSLISLLALATAWAYLTLPGVWSMAVLVAAAVPITIVANAGRLVLTGLFGQWFGVQYAQGFFHSFSGWIIFLFAFVCLLGVHGLVRLVGMRVRRHASCVARRV